ncbi:LuxR C-terminal-related transcriptional regulator [Lutimonas zeaxanthinifaciens]|uniref:LuxR C-terminal-related transcriptional regulator n=1 Tax=Lutimonas zeaxanthinifaciens TaxID=3060215 RepID=UPI00265C9AA5|nr:LuxR C-terminal-related transcriptional regulator [Lutimonas sp. YSD2104]WKK65087.1 LuxR C-terminal-related transcriptional regulator [Lutimonas sp. YSD2104]
MIQRTRLVKPKMHDNFVERTRLFKTLEENWQKSFHQIVAPAGYGKSSLMSLWLDQRNDSYSWFTIDDDCNDFRVFLSYLAEFLRVDKESSHSELLELAEAHELPEMNYIRQKVLQAISYVEPAHVFVFDDYHLIQNEDIHSLMNTIVKNFSSEFKLVILSRSSPKLNFQKEEIYGQLHNIDLNNLKFLPEEIQLLSLKAFRTPLDKNTAQLIYKTSEGWIIPIRLILKSYSQGVAVNEIIDGIRFQSKGMNDYLLEEVLNFESDEVKDIMMAISFFERFNFDMIYLIISADDLKTPEENALVVDQMKDFISRSLFVISLDDSAYWYRFHELVARFLKARSSQFFHTKRRNETIKTVSNYLETLGFFDEALRLNLKYDLITPAIDILVRHRDRYLNLNRFDIIEKWLGYFPSEITNQEPELLLMKMYLCELSSDFDSIKIYATRLKKIISQSNLSLELSDKYWVEYHCLTSIVHLFNGNSEKGLEKMTLVINLASREQTYVLGFCLIFKSLVLASSGRQKEARVMLENDRNKLSLEDSILISQNLLANAYVEYMCGNLKALEYETSSILKLAMPNDFYAVFTMANYYAAISHYFQNRLEKIEIYLDPPMQHKFRSRPAWILHLLYVKALYLTAQCRDDEWLKCLEEMEDYNRAITHLDFSNSLGIMKCELYLLQGKVKEAWNISLKVDFLEMGVTHRYFCPRLTRIKLFIFIGSSRQLKIAEQLILEFENELKEPQSRIMKLQVRSLKILCLAKQGRITVALDLLKALLMETQKEDIIRLYTDLGEEMRELLNEIPDSGPWESHLFKVLSSFEEKDSFIKLKKKKERRQEVFQIFNSLSTGELKILDLMSQGMRNKEIADDMHYSVGTVKTYVYNLYKKIEVNNRTNAILLYNDFKNSSS